MGRHEETLAVSKENVNEKVGFDQVTGNSHSLIVCSKHIKEI